MTAVTNIQATNMTFSINVSQLYFMSTICQSIQEATIRFLRMGLYSKLIRLSHHHQTEIVYFTKQSKLQILVDSNILRYLFVPFNNYILHFFNLHKIIIVL